MRESSCACRVLMGKPDGRRPLERPRHIWEDNIKMYLIDRWLAFVFAVINLWVL
jgi:hypothetical protein